MSGLSETERLHLARAVYSATGHLPPRDESDLSMVRDEIETAVEQIVARHTAAAITAERNRLADEIDALRPLHKTGSDYDRAYRNAAAIIRPART